MIDFVLYAWLVMFALLFGFFFVLQPKLGRFHLYIKKNFSEHFESCRPSLFLFKHNEQLVFLIFMYKRKYEVTADESLLFEGNRFRRCILANIYATLLFFVLTFLVFAIGWSGNL